VPSRPHKPLVFVSHAHEDAQIAVCLKDFLNEAFPDALDVFVSSDGASIRAGDNWSCAVEVAIRRAEIVLVLLTAKSIDRRWIYFEAGGAYFAGKRVIPICCRDFQLSQLGSPLNCLQALRGHCAEGAAAMLTEISDFFGLGQAQARADSLARFLAGQPCDAGTQEQVRAANEILPLFFVIDTSASTSGGTINEASRSLQEFVDISRSDQSGAVSVLISIITFDTNATLVIPPTPIEILDELPRFSPGGATAAGAAFRLLASVSRDSSSIPKGSRDPQVIFVSDGSPTDDWRSGLKSFVETPLGKRARITCIGIGPHVSRSVLDEIATDAVFLVSETQSTLANLAKDVARKRL
jgi:uncharacterized protein YegL